jgi:hypothetical protein
MDLAFCLAHISIHRTAVIYPFQLAEVEISTFAGAKLLDLSPILKNTFD